MREAVIALTADRQHGLTTALLDIACANARRGDTVHFWSTTVHATRNAFEQARALLHGELGMRARPTNGSEEIRFGSGGRLLFVNPHTGPERGLADVQVSDGEHGGRITRRCNR